MIITIDKAGRLVVPQRYREALNLFPGARLEIEADGQSLRLTPAGQGESLVEKQGFLVHHGPGQSDIDISVFIRGERERRARTSK